MPTSFARHVAPNGVVLLRCIALGVSHGFSTRLGGTSEGAYEGLNLGLSSGDDEATVRENRTLWRAALGLSVPIVALHQVHGPVVHVADAELPHGTQGDALVAATAGTPIGVLTADCAPILLADAKTGVVAAVHAGWKGTVARVAQAAVATMVERYGVDPANLTAAIGPAIGPCCFEVGDEVIDATRANPWEGWEAAVRPGPRRNHLDLFAANAAQLRAVGVGAVHASGLCTACDAATFYSWRRDGGVTGRMQSVITCGGPPP